MGKEQKDKIQTLTEIVQSLHAHKDKMISELNLLLGRIKATEDMIVYEKTGKFPGWQEQESSAEVVEEG